MNLLKNCKATRLVNATAVGTTNINGSILDMSGWDGVLFILLGGAITDGGLSIKAQQGQAANMSDAADLAGTLTTLADADDNKAALLDLYRPEERYVRPVVVRGGATGAVFDGVIAIQYCGSKLPSTHDATTVGAAKVVASPAEGVA